MGVRNAVWEGVRAGRRERKGRDEGLRMTECEGVRNVDREGREGRVRRYGGW